VITQDAGLYRPMPTDPGWGALRAVQTHHIHLAPALPFGWIDEPPGINRLLGLRWLAATLHPEIFPWDERAGAREFCELFYHAKPSDAALDRILQSRP
jgi:iron complex transport system substrate-binding protein